MKNDDDPKSKTYLKLTKDQFIRVLFDLKRAGDYFFVKACWAANNNPQMKKTPNHKFVFVSNDRSAICYSLMKQNPCVLTSWAENDGWTMTIYNPDAHIQAKQTQVTKKSQDSKQTQATKQKQTQAKNAETVRTVVSTAITKAINAQTTRQAAMEAQMQMQRIKSVITELASKSRYDKNKDMYVPKIKDAILETMVDPTDRHTFKTYVNKQHGSVKADMMSGTSLDKSYKKSDAYQAYMVKERNPIWFLMDDSMPSTSQGGKGGSNLETEVEDTGVADIGIPISDILKHSVHPQSELYRYLKFYSKLSPFMTFFNFVVIRHVFYMMYGNDNKRDFDTVTIDTTDAMSSQELSRMGRTYPQMVKLIQGTMRNTNVKKRQSISNNIISNNNNNVRVNIVTQGNRGKYANIIK